MIILVDQITESPKKVRFAESMEELNRVTELARDYRFPDSVDVDLIFYRSGSEIVFEGRFGGRLQGNCGRCLKSYFFALEKRFSFVLTPEPFSGRSKELNRDELGLSFYSGQEINLFPFIQEQVLLALPTRPLCEEGCRGLCAGCGADLNREPCRCAALPGDPRMALFRNLKINA
ncbi:MAG: DUF177 domain-containing protein [Deltaproteobacteria bacterium]|nr:DUF177 domain-containing protein [Deltaproteobacteria bacterium]